MSDGTNKGRYGQCGPDACGEKTIVGWEECFCGLPWMYEEYEEASKVMEDKALKNKENRHVR